MGTRENTVENYLKKQVSRKGGITRKFVSPGRTGVPDQMVIFDDIYMVEVKTIDGSMSPAQKRECQRLVDSKCRVAIVYGTAGVDKFISMVNSWDPKLKEVRELR